MAGTFQATIGWKFAPLINLREHDIDIYSMITIFITAVTETAREIIVKERLREKKTWVIGDVLGLCNEKRGLRRGGMKKKELKNTKKLTRGLRKP